MAVAVAAWLVLRFSPYASGSGIPHVEAALDQQLPPAPPHLILVKFFGGLLAIGAGLAFGREGPSVQMGAVVAHIVGRISRRGWPDRRALLAAGAGLAVAFNAPIAGAIFCSRSWAAVRYPDRHRGTRHLGDGDPCCPPVSRRRAQLSCTARPFTNRCASMRLGANDRIGSLKQAVSDPEITGDCRLRCHPSSADPGGYCERQLWGNSTRSGTLRAMAQ